MGIYPISLPVNWFYYPFCTGFQKPLYRRYNVSGGWFALKKVEICHLCCKFDWNWKELVLNAYFTVIYRTNCRNVVSYTWVHLQHAYWLMDVIERVRHSDNDVISRDSTWSSCASRLCTCSLRLCRFCLSCCYLPICNIYGIYCLYRRWIWSKVCSKVICYWLSMKGNA